MQSAQTELDFINLYLESLSNKSVRYGADYMQRALPKPLKIKRVPVINNTIEEPKPINTAREVPGNANKFEVTVKVLKPAKQFTIGNLTSTDTVSQLKQRIYQQQSIPVQRQRLLIKGKVLAEQKTLEEASIKEGITIHLMMTAAPATATATATTTGRFGVSLEAEKKLSSPEFWEALEKTIVEQVGEEDAKLVLSKVKASLTP